jgi:hypothetical protein
MSAAKYDLSIPKGADFSFTLRILDAFEDPVTLSGGSTAFKAEIREANRKPLAAAFTVTAIGDGQLRFDLSNEKTRILNIDARYKWDFFWTNPSGVVDKLLFGDVTVEPNISNM